MSKQFSEYIYNNHLKNVKLQIDTFKKNTDRTFKKKFRNDQKSIHSTLLLIDYFDIAVYKNLVLLHYYTNLFLIKNNTNN